MASFLRNSGPGGRGQDDKRLLEKNKIRERLNNLLFRKKICQLRTASHVSHNPDIIIFTNSNLR